MLPELASTENVFRRCGRREKYLAASRVPLLPRSWSCRLVSRPPAAHAPAGRVSRKHQRPWNAGIYDHEFHVCHSMLLARQDCNDPLCGYSEIRLCHIARRFPCRTLKSGSNQISEQPKSFSSCGRRDEPPLQMQHGSSITSHGIRVDPASSFCRIPETLQRQANLIGCTHFEDDCRNEHCRLTLAQSKPERGADQQREPKRFVTLPFDFVVLGKTLPTGAYRLSLLADDKCEGPILSSYENRISVFVPPVEIESTSAERPHLSFERVGGEPFLSRIQTTDDVYNIRVFHSLIMEAAEKTRDNGYASGSSGSK